MGSHALMQQRLPALDPVQDLKITDLEVVSALARAASAQDFLRHALLYDLIAMLFSIRAVTVIGSDCMQPMPLFAVPAV